LARQGRGVLVPETVQHSRIIAGLEQKIQELGIQHEELERHNNDLMDNTFIQDSEIKILRRKIQGYEGKALIDPRKMIDLPQRLRQNLKKVVESIKDDHEKQYVKSLIDPFHESTYGVRVPSILPRDTATFNTFLSAELPSNTDVLLIANLEQGARIQML